MATFELLLQVGALGAIVTRLSQPPRHTEHDRLAVGDEMRPAGSRRSLNGTGLIVIY